MPLNAILHTSGDSKDRRATFLLGASFVTMLAMLLFAVIAGPKILSSASTTAEIQRGNEINGCRAGYRSQVDDASSRLQTSRAHLDVATSEGFTAIVSRDQTTLTDAVAKSIKVRAAVLGDAENLSTVTDRYSDLVRLSRQDPKKFLKVCRREAP